MKLKRVMVLVFLFGPLLFLLLFLGIMGCLNEEESRIDSSYETGIGLSEEVVGYAPVVEKYAEEYEIDDYEEYLLAIMQVESGGRGKDVMQSLTQINMPEKDKTPEESIRRACEYFALLLRIKSKKEIDMETVIQSYNYGIDYTGYVAERGQEHTFALACDYAELKSGGVRTVYNNEIAIRVNGGWRYEYGNMFYVYLVKQYLPSAELPIETANAVIQEAVKYTGWVYCWGGASPATSFDCSGLVQWCYGSAGILLPRTAQEQYDSVEHIDFNAAEPGDLVFFTGTYNSGTYISHVGIYVGGGRPDVSCWGSDRVCRFGKRILAEPSCVCWPDQRCRKGE